MGACQTGGSAIDFVTRKEGVEFRRAVEILRGTSGRMGLEGVIARSETTWQSQKERIFSNRDSHANTRNDNGAGSVPLHGSTIIKKNSEFSDSEKDLIDSVLGYYRETLFRSEDAMKYLSGRGFTDVGILRNFGENRSRIRCDRKNISWR